MLLSPLKEELVSIFQQYKAEAPEPLNSKLPNRCSRADAIQDHVQKRRGPDILLPGLRCYTYTYMNVCQFMYIYIYIYIYILDKNLRNKTTDLIL